MLTRAEILRKLQEDPNWEPDLDATDEEWELYDEVKREMEGGTDEEEDEEMESPAPRTPEVDYTPSEEDDDDDYFDDDDDDDDDDEDW